MEKTIKHVYIGLPEQLKEVVLWVSRQYRVNPLSHQPGGCDVIVEYHEGGVFGCDWIKFPSRYVSKIFMREISKDRETDYENLDEIIQLKIIKEKIFRIFARKYKDEVEYETVPFEELWNSATSEDIPWDLLEKLERK